MNYADLLERMSLLDSCAISDALDSMGMSGVADGLERRSTREKIVGRVRTMKLAGGSPPEGSTTHLGTRSVEEASDMDVIAVEQRTGVNAAGWGGVLSHAARLRGVRGIIVDGPVRDVDEFSEVGMPVFSRAVTPTTARGRIHEAAINEPVTMGDVTVNPGDLVIADGTGVVFVPVAVAETVVAVAERIAAKEKLMVDAVHRGEPATEVMGRDYETLLGTQD